MNFNLISGENNGYDYTVRFREDVVIEKNSKAYLNFACLSRIGKVVLDTDNTLTLTTTSMLPPVLPSDQTTSTNFTYTGTIPRGIYTYGDLQEKIKQFLNDCRGSALPQAGNKLYYYTPNLIEFRPESDNDIVLGYFLDNSTRWINKNASLDAVNVKAMAPKDLDVAVKTSPTALEPIYDSYALSSTHYYHYAYKCDGQSQNSNLIHIKTNVDMAQQTGALFCGLYSKEYAGTAGNTDPNRTAGNSINLTPKGSGTTKAQIPRCFMGVEITEKRSKIGQCLRVWVGCKNASAPLQTISEFTSINTPIIAMKQVFKTSLTNIWPGLDNHAEFAIQTYYDTTSDNYQGNNKQLYFRVIKYEGQEQITGNMILYDSQRDGIFFPYSFFKYTNPTSADDVNSSIPFNIIMCAQAQNEGFTDVVYKEFDKTTNNLNTNPKCIMENYSIAVSKELADYLQTVNTGQLYPNVCEMRGSGFYYLTDMRLTWKKTNYTIEIENLPLKNFKNTAEGANGGFSQNILANIPAPFSNVIESNTPDDATVSSIFQPNFPIMTYMFNQPIRLNNFRVKIKNMADDKPAFELINSVVNFTVVPGTE